MRFSVIESCEQRFARATSKAIVSLDEAMNLATSLGQRIEEIRPPADLVVGLANGGILPAIVAAKTAGLDCEIVRVRRLSSRMKRLVEPLRYLLRLQFLSATFRPAKSLGLALGRKANRVKVDGNLSFDPKGRRVVIVDDCVDSGISVSRVRQLLMDRGAASVRVAVLCWTTKFDSEALNRVTPDIYLHRLLHTYPWALNSPDYARFKRWVRKSGVSSWR